MSAIKKITITKLNNLLANSRLSEALGFLKSQDFENQPLVEGLSFVEIVKKFNEETPRLEQESKPDLQIFKFLGPWGPPHKSESWKMYSNLEKILEYLKQRFLLQVECTRQEYIKKYNPYVTVFKEIHGEPSNEVTALILKEQVTELLRTALLFQEWKFFEKNLYNETLKRDFVKNGKITPSGNWRNEATILSEVYKKYWDFTFKLGNPWYDINQGANWIGGQSWCGFKN